MKIEIVLTITTRQCLLVQQLLRNHLLMARIYLDCVLFLWHSIVERSVSTEHYIMACYRFRWFLRYQGTSSRTRFSNFRLMTKKRRNIYHRPTDS